MVLTILTLVDLEQQISPQQSFCWCPPRRVGLRLPLHWLLAEETSFSDECFDQSLPLLSLF